MKLKDLFRRQNGPRSAPEHRSSSVPPSERRFAVIDTETTGLFPGGHDRIIEIAIVQVSSTGEVVEEYATLINPERDVGSTRTHGIRASDLSGAPRFVDLVGDIAMRLDGRVFVGHNVRFDCDFIVAEYSRAGFSIHPTARLCTMALARRVAGKLERYRLADCCTHFSVDLAQAHSAAADARATAGLLARCIDRVGLTAALDLIEDGEPVHERVPWPTVSPTGRVWRRSEAASTPPSYLAQLVQQLPHSPEVDSPTCLAYWDLLDRAIEDRIITEEESAQLLETARRWGLARGDVESVHRAYCAGLVDVATRDGVVTDSERRDLLAATSALGCGGKWLEEAIREGLQRQTAGPTITPGPAGETLRGKTVCFTGESQCRIGGEAMTRDIAEQLAASAGLIVARNVTKKLDILVVADPSSQSGKARKARQAGTRIMGERAFWQKMGVEVS